MHVNGTWDIRVGADLLSYFLRLRKKGNYYWKLSNDECLELIKILCASYNVPLVPVFSTTNTAELRQQGACGLCCWRSGRADIYTYPRPHFKTVAHEGYHHIDFYYKYALRRRTYDSSDAKNYAWNFAERLWGACVSAAKAVGSTVAMRPAVAAMDVPKTYATYAEIFDNLDGVRAAFELVGGAKGWRKPARLTPAADTIKICKQILKLPEGKSCVRKVYALSDGRYLFQWVI